MEYHVQPIHVGLGLLQYMNELIVILELEERVLVNLVKPCNSSNRNTKSTVKRYLQVWFDASNEQNLSQSWDLSVLLAAIERFPTKEIRAFPTCLWFLRIFYFLVFLVSRFILTFAIIILLNIFLHFCCFSFHFPVTTHPSLIFLFSRVFLLF